jgi:hypothetical protein
VGFVFCGRGADGSFRWFGTGFGIRSRVDGVAGCGLEFAGFAERG